LRTVTVGSVRCPKTRQDRLAAIVFEHRCAIHDLRTAEAYLAPDESSPRYAAVTSPARSAGFELASCKLLVGDSIEELTDLLDRERDSECFAQGRVWDLDAPWDSGGNLEIAEYRLIDLIGKRHAV
jgi:hypothetical protein